MTSLRVLCPAAFLIALGLTATSPAFAAPDAPTFEERLRAELGVAGGLTADQVGGRAVQTSAALRARRAQLEAASADVDRAWAGYYPDLNLTARYARLSDVGTNNAGSVVVAPGVPPGASATGAQLVNFPLSFPSLLNQYSFGAGLNVPLSDYVLRVPHSRAAASASEASAREDLNAAVKSADGDARTTYYLWVRARLGVLVAEQALDQANAHLTDAKHALDVGTASQADVLRVESLAAQNEATLESSRHLTAELEQALRIALHDPASPGYRIGEDVQVEPAPLGVPEQLGPLTNYALEHRSELAALDAKVRAARASTDLERAGYLPRLDLFADAQYSNPNPRVFPQQDEFRGSWDVGAQLSWQLGRVPGAVPAVRGASARAEAAQAERRATEDSIARQVSIALRDVLDARSSIQASERGLKAAEESYRVRRLLFQNGRATSTELLDAELELTRSRLGMVNARLDLRVAHVRLEQAIGKARRVG